MATNILKTRHFELAVLAQGDQAAVQLAVILPGKLDTKDYAHIRSHVDFLANQGYLAVSFDAPGIWESPGDIALYTMSNYLQAVHEVIEAFGNRPTLVLGHSRGGSIAMLAGTSNPHVTHFGSIMSYYSFKPEAHPERYTEEWRRDGFHETRRNDPKHPETKRSFKLPFAFYEDQLQYDVLPALAASTKPKFFIFGERDSLVDPQIVKTAFEKSAQPKQLYSIDSDHDYRHSQESIDQVNHHLATFLSAQK